MGMYCLSRKKHWTSFISILFWISLVILGCFKTASTLGNETDRLALLALKDQWVTDTSLGTLPSWNDSLHFCQWQGVQCGRRHQRVTVLRLTSLRLAGPISPSLGNLTFLRELTINENALHGEIPKEIGHLRRMQVLNLGNNTLQGRIPWELTNCSNLQVIIFSWNNLTGEIPFQVGSLLQLTRLSLSVNFLVGSVPSSLGNLSSLGTLALARNNFEGNIPPSLGGLSRLDYLTLNSNNKLTGLIPPSLYNLSSLEIFDLSVNRFSGSLISNIDLAFPNLLIFIIADNQFTGTIPASVSNISRLQYLEIFQNYFTGSVPNDLGNLMNLQSLNIGHNLLGSGKIGDLNFLESLTNCTQLELVYINTNRFGGVIPNSISNLSIQLEQLYMGVNQISGHIPEGIGNLVGLTVLEMGNNLLQGAIPDSIGKLQKLSRLFFHRNILSGNIPSIIGNLSQLFELYLHTNNLEGGIPLALSGSTRMQNVFLSQNNLSGSIPNQIFNLLENLILLNISYNSLTGSLPPDIGHLKNLEQLHVYENKLSGKIPVEIGECSSLELLQMDGNFFQGTIPLSLSSLKAIRNIDLSRNNLSGTIPHELESLALLVSLNLSFNQLEGEVPTGGVFENVSTVSITGNSKLCGGIPELKLPLCLNQKTRKKGNRLSTRVIVTIIISILLSSALIVILAIYLWRRKLMKKPKPASTSLLGDGYMRVTYKELLKATEGFESSNLIGVGGFGSVYKGILPRAEKPVAVKVLNLQRNGASKSFMAECKALRKIRHRNLLKIITSCSSVDYKGNDFKALVFEFMSNGSLENWLHTNAQHEPRNLTLTQRLDIAIDMANALDYLHHHCETPIVHCDLKPSNVLLDDDMVAHVGDFGLAKLISGASDNFSRDHTNSAALKGSIGYVAPEYGMGGAVSPQGDMYSYGIILLEMITAKRPTDDLFKDGNSLHNLCKTAIPERIEEIVDSYLLKNFDETTNSRRNQHNLEIAWWDCLASIATIGVACSVEYPDGRMDIQSVIRDLLAIKERLFSIGINGHEMLNQA